MEPSGCRKRRRYCLTRGPQSVLGHHRSRTVAQMVMNHLFHAGQVNERNDWPAEPVQSGLPCTNAIIDAKEFKNTAGIDPQELGHRAHSKFTLKNSTNRVTKAFHEHPLEFLGEYRGRRRLQRTICFQVTPLWAALRNMKLSMVFTRNMDGFNALPKIKNRRGKAFSWNRRTKPKNSQKISHFFANYVVERN